jgi:hypothetical protein
VSQNEQVGRDHRLGLWSLITGLTSVESPKGDILNICKVGSKLGYVLFSLTCSHPPRVIWILSYRPPKSRRDLWNTLYFKCYLTLRSSVLLEKLVVAQPANKIRTIYGTWRFVTVHKNPCEGYQFTECVSWIVMQSNHDIVPLSVHLNFWHCVKDGGKFEYGTVGNFCLQTSMDAKRWWHYVGGWLYFISGVLL